MASPWMLSLVLFASPPVPSADATGSPSTSHTAAQTAEFRDAYRRAASKSGRIEANTIVTWTGQYRALPNVAGLKPEERQRMQRSLRARLLRSRERLLAGGGPQNRMNELIELIQTTVAPDSWAPGGPAIFALGGAGGNIVGGAQAGNANANALSLIDLIQNTVQPDTWQINGGNGVIMPAPW